MPDIMNGLPNICGMERPLEEVLRNRGPVFLSETNLRLDQIRAAFAIALHMQQPLIPAGGPDLSTAELISNLDHMMRNPQTGDNHNASVFADCYGRMGSILPDLVREGRNPRIMLDYSGELLFGLRKMGRGDVLDRLRPITCDPGLRRNTEWLGTMWGHAVASSTPVPDLKLHIRAWQQHFLTLFGPDALWRVRGFSPPEMHLPNHPDVCYEYVKTLRECGYQWMLVQEHSVETPDGQGLREKHLPYRLIARNSRGQEATIIAVIKTQGSDTKLVAQMQPFYEAQSLQRREIAGRAVPPLVTQIGDGENGGVMMNEFPSGYRQAHYRCGTEGVVAINVTEYLELLHKNGITEDKLPPLQPIQQHKVFARIQNWEEGAADKAIEELRRQQPHFTLEGGSWTNNISWVKGYENVLTPMNQLSALFHQTLDNRPLDLNGHPYRNALFHLLVSQTSCFRYWGQGLWTDYAREICRRGTAILTHDF